MSSGFLVSLLPVVPFAMTDPDTVPSFCDYVSMRQLWSTGVALSQKQLEGRNPKN